MSYAGADGKRRRGISWRITVPTVALVSVAMVAAVLSIAPSQEAAAQNVGGPQTCYVMNEASPSQLVRIDNADGAATATLVPGGGVTGTNLESLAYRNGPQGGAAPHLWSVDPSNDQLATIDETDGTRVNQGATDNQDIDGIVWINDNDLDPTNDQLWASDRIADSGGGAVQDQLYRLNLDGSIAAGPFPINITGVDNTPATENNDVDGLAWDPTTGILYGVVGGDTTLNTLITISYAPGSEGTAVAVGSEGAALIFDIEGLAFDDAGQLYGMTGEDPDNPPNNGPDTNDRLWRIDKTAGSTAGIGGELLNLNAFGDDFEAMDCGGWTPEPASISDFVFIDNNGNDAQDPTEPGLDGVGVELFDCADNSVATTTTAGGGFYSFDDLEAGCYYVVFTLPGGRTFVPADQGGDDALDSDVDAGGTTPDINILAGEDNDTIDAGVEPLLGSISDFVFVDTNNDGNQDAGEPGLEGATVELFDCADNLLGTETTLADGLYSFDGLVEGCYYVVFTLPGGRPFVPADQGGDDDLDSDANPVDGRTPDITLAPGETNTSIDAGAQPLGSISDFVFVDRDADGLQDGNEPGLIGVLVEVLDSGGNVVGSDTTDVDGLYLVGGLPAGDYTVRFTPPAGRTFTPLQNEGGDDTIDSDVDAAGLTGTVTLTAGQDRTDVDAGVEPLLGSIADRVWDDTDGDGIQDPGEPGIQGVLVEVLDGGGNVVGSDTTDVNGEYLVDQLLADDYTVRFTAPVGRVFTQQDQGLDDDTDSDVNAAGLTGTVTLTPGQARTDVDAGILPDLGSISNFVWEDTNGDGIQNAGEPGIEGIAVEVFDSNGDSAGTDTTDVDGLYLVGNLPAGDYTVEFTTPAGRSWTQQSQGGNTALDSDVAVDGVTGTVTLAAGEDRTDIDAGVAPLLGSIANFVFEDRNGDGIQDAGEPGVEGVLVEVFDSNGVSAGTDTTDVDGLYLVGDLLAGDYTVEFTTPAGRTWTQQDQGGNDATDSDVDAAGVTGTVALTPGQDRTDVDAGLLPLLGSISDFVFEDRDQDGIQDPGDPGIQGILVQVFDSNGDLAGSDTTDVDGLYLVDNLLDDTYTVEFALPAGRTFTGQNVGALDAIDSDPNAAGVTDAIPLAPGQNRDDVDAGILPLLGSISNFVFEDRDQDGIQDPGEPGVEGVAVEVFDSNGQSAGTDTTDVDGLYLVDNLLDDTYTVQFTTPAGRVWTAQDQGGNDAIDSDVDASGLTGFIPLGVDEDRTDVDAGLLPLLGSISNFVWEDTNQDGIQDAGEPGLEGVGVEVFDSNGVSVGTDTTDVDGLYLVGDLLDDNYTVEFTLPAGRALSPQDQGGNDALDSDPDPGTNTTAPVPLLPGEDRTDVDAGVLPLGSISDYVWEDTNGDGIQDAGEPAVGGVAVEVFDSNGVSVGTDTTDVDGLYLVDLLPADTYTVQFTTPAGRTWTQQDQGGNDATDSDVDATGVTAGIPLAAGEDRTDVDAGLLPAPVGSISDFVWEDRNGDGIQDAGEPGIEGVAVEVFDSNGVSAGTATTGPDGDWIVGNLPAGDYTVQFTLPAGRTFSPQSQGGDPALDSDADATGLTGTVTLAGGEDNTDVDAGILPLLGSFGDFVWEDTNQDGIQDAGEPGIEGVAVELFGSNGSVGTDTTDVDGLYLFEDLLDDDYTVQFTLPTGRTWTLRDQGLDDTVDSDVNPADGTTVAYSLAPGEDYRDHDAGIAPLLGSLSDFVWEDTNGDGIQDVGEPGIEGVVVEVFDSNGVSAGTDTTDVDGLYLVDLLPADTYTVQFTTPAGRTWTQQDQGGNDATDSDVDATGVTAGVPLAAGEDITDVDAGILPLLGSISDFVWEDTNGDGIQDVGEPGIEGVAVEVFDSNGVSAGTDTTDVDGLYLVDLLPADTYTVQFTTPAGRTWTQQDQGGNDATDSDVDATGVTAGVPLAAGEDRTDVDAGILPLLGSISDFVWEDTNSDGIQDVGEPAVGGVAVEVFDSNGVSAGTDTTDVDGLYLVDLLPADTYTVQFTTPAGRTWTLQDQGGNDATDSDVDATGVTAGVPLAAGEDRTDVDAGLLPAPVGSISDFVWEDTNGDGIQDAGEPGIEGVAVEVFDSNGVSAGTATTGPDGDWIVGNLPAGDYTVQFTLPAGRTFSPQDQGGNDTTDSDPDATGLTGTVTLAAGEDNTDVDAGILPLLGSISDFVWEDTNGDGIQDVGEPGVQGVAVEVFDSNGVSAGTDVTDAAGLYLVDLLPADTYTVQFTTPAGRTWTQQDQGGIDATDSDVDATGVTAGVPLAAGEDRTDVDAGVAPLLGSISDFVWEDTNSDGIQDVGEPAVGGVAVEVFDSNGVSAGTDTTDANGFYLVGGLLADTYTVQFTTPAGRTWTQQDQGGNDATDSDVDATGVTAGVPLAAGEDRTDVDAGLLPAPVGSISDFVFEDTNGDGIQDAGEPGIEGVAVEVFDSNGVSVGTATTGPDGDYIVGNLPAGDYTVQFTLPAGRTFSPQSQGGDPALDSDADATGLTGTITLAAGEDNTDVDAGILPLLGSISDFVFEDTNGDGIQDAGEPGIEGVAVEVFDSNGDSAGTATTGPDGDYIVGNLPADTYTVQFTTPAGRTWTLQDQGGNDATDSDVDATGVTAGVPLAAGEDRTDVDAGVAPLLGSISDFVWEDTNSDGIQDVGEPAVGGVAVEVFDSNGVSAGTDTTDANGLYLVDLLPADTYTVQFTTPAGRTWTLQDQGGNDATDSDVDATGVTAGVPLAAGEDRTDVDAGLLPAPVGSISDFVWEDTNGDGIQDAGEPGIEGVAVEVFDSNGVSAGTATTGPDGDWIVGNLPAGDYTVQFTLPAGRTFSPQDQGGNDATDSDPDATGLTGTVTLAAGEDNTDVDAGILPLLGSLSDFVWEDTNGDGIQDAGEPGIEGVAVEVFDSNGVSAGTATTGPDGDWIVGNLPAGDYTVQFTLPGGRTFSPQDQGGNDATDSDPDATGLTGTVTLAAGEDRTDVDAGILPVVTQAALGNFVWNDLDEDGIQDAGEPGIEGVNITVYSIVAGNLGAVAATAVTDSDGLWQVDLDPGEYRVLVTQPAGSDGFTLRDTPSNDALDSDVLTSGVELGFTDIYTLADGETNLTVDAGVIFPPALAQLGNFVWNDLNADGIQDAGEPGIPGVTVEILDAGTVIGNAVTDANGEWTFDVAAGTYSARIINNTLGGFTTQDAGGNDALDSDVNPATGETAPVTVAAGEINSTLDAGIVFQAEVGDTVFNDLNQDGIQDTGEPGIEGVTVEILDTNGDVVGTAVTDANGNWLIGVDPGTYTARFVNNTGGTFSPQDQGGDDGADSDVDPATGVTAPFTVIADDTDLTIDAGLFFPENPVIGLAKALTAGPTLNGAGNYELTYTFNIENLGDVDLDSIVLTDDFAATFAPGTLVTGPTPNGGTCSAEVAGGTGALAVGESCVAVWDVEASGLVAGTTYNNTATVTGTSPLGEDVSDVSDDGTDVDENDNGDPGDPGEDTPTPATVPENPVIGLAKALTAGPTLNGAGNYELTYTFNIENLGNTPLTDVTLTDDFAATFTGGTVVTGPTANGGTCSAEVAAGTGSLAVGGSCVAVWDVEVSGLVAGTTYNNTATVEGTSPLGVDVSDVSDDGTDVDENDNGDPGDPGEDTPTPATVPENPVIGLAKALTAGPTLNGAGNYELTYTFNIENLGNTPLTDVTLTDDFAATFTGGTVVTGPTANGGTCSAEVAAGTGSLAVGASCVAVWDVEVSGLVPGTTYNNTATVEGTSPLGVDVTDISDDGTITDPNSNGDPGDPGEDDPTPATVPVADQAVIGNLAFEDTNGDGIQDPGEPGLAGVTVEIRDGDGNVIETVTTDSNGQWSSSPLDPGTYSVCFTAPSGFGFSPTGVGSDPELDSNANTDGCTDSFTLVADEVNNSIDVGLVPLGSIGNQVFNDANGNGVRDPGESPVAGAVVTLFVANDDGSRGVQVAQQTTGTDGQYLFEDLLPGDYILVVTPPVGFNVTTPNQGDDSTDSDFDPTTGESPVITVGPGENVVNIDAGLVLAPVVVVPPNNPQLEYPGPFTNPPSVDSPPNPQPSPPLATTGSNSNLLATLAIALLGAGGLLSVRARRENEDGTE